MNEPHDVGSSFVDLESGSKTSEPGSRGEILRRIKNSNQQMQNPASRAQNQENRTRKKQHIDFLSFLCLPIGSWGYIMMFSNAFCSIPCFRRDLISVLLGRAAGLWNSGPSICPGPRRAVEELLQGHVPRRCSPSCGVQGTLGERQTDRQEDMTGQESTLDGL